MNSQRRGRLSLETTLAMTVAVLVAPLLWRVAVPPLRGNALAAQASAVRPTTPANDLPVLATLPAFELVDQQATAFGSRQLRERLWIANFVFTRCTATCPQQTERMAALQARLAQHKAWNEIRLVSFSVDPEHDVPAVLASYAQKARADASHWRFLTGGREAIWGLAREGFKLPVEEAKAVDAGSPILHGSQLLLVDFYGRVRGMYDGMSAESAAAIVRDVDQLLAERVPVPAEALAPAWLEPRRAAQLASASQIGVDHDFQFTDRIEESGITFQNKIVDDAGKSYTSAHYDHGNGLAIADVDGDGRLDAYLLTQAGENELWRNLGGGRFEEITPRSPGLALAGRVSVTGSFADVDNDGDPDLFVTTVRGGNVLFENTGGGKFRDVTANSGLGYSGHSSGAVFFDYDRDGLLDLFVSNVGKYTLEEVRTVTMEPLRGEAPAEHRFFAAIKDAFGGHLKPEERNERSILYRNLGERRFQDVSEATGLVDVCWTGDASPLDGNEDGWPDLYVLNMQGHNEYYENQEGKRFARMSKERFPSTPWGAMGIKVLDFENDGHLDVFITDMHSDMSIEIGPEAEKKKSDMKWPPRFVLSAEFDPQPGRGYIWGNAFFRNEGGGKFTEISDRIGAENYWPWGLSAGDLNADGFEDVFITASMNFPFRYCVNSLLLNDRGQTFRDCEFILGVEPRREGRTATMWFELDVDGADRDYAQKESWGLRGKRQIWSALGSKSSAIFDLDDDGDLDILTNEVNMGPMVLVSDLAARKKDLKYLEVRLVGKLSNRDGLGALVRLRAGERQFVKAHDGCTGYLSHGLAPLYFGLTGAAAVDSVEVVWPTGKTQTIAGPVATNRTLVVEEQ